MATATMEQATAKRPHTPNVDERTPEQKLADSLKRLVDGVFDRLATEPALEGAITCIGKQVAEGATLAEAAAMLSDFATIAATLAAESAKPESKGLTIPIRVGKQATDVQRGDAAYWCRVLLKDDTNTRRSVLRIKRG